MNDQELADMLSKKYQGSRITEVQVVVGNPIGFRFVLENDKEERGSILIQGVLKTQLTGPEITVRAGVNFGLEDFRK